MKKILHLLLLLFISTNLYNQVVISENIYTNHPNFNDEVDPLMACAWEYSFELTVSDAQCPSFEAMLPSDLTYDQNILLENCTGSITGNVLSITVIDVNTNAVVRIKMTDLCNINVAQISNLDVSYDFLGSTCDYEINRIENLQIVIPELTFDNLSYSDQDNLGAGQVDPDEELHQWLYFKNLDYEFTRSWDILITAGHVRHLNIDYTPESEMNVQSFILTGPNGNINADITSNPIEITECDIITLFGTNYIDTDQTIQVQEVFTIAECSSGLSTQTDFLVEILCKDNCQGDCNVPTACDLPAQSCNFTSDQHFNISVNDYNSSLGISDLDFCNSSNGCFFDYNQGINPNPSFIDFCGDEASDISFEFTCGAVNLAQNCHYSGAKRIDKIQFPIDLDAFSFDYINDLDQVFLVANGVEVPFSNLPTGFLDFSTGNNICSIDFELMSEDYASLWGNPMPFTNWFDDDIYRDIIDGTVFYIVFKNRILDFENAEAIGTGQNLSEFQGLNFAYLFNTGIGYYSFTQSYYRMCTMFSEPNTECIATNGPGQKTCQLEYNQFKYRNGINVSGFAESSDPDVSFNQPEVTVDFYFNDAGANPWTFIYSGSANPFPGPNFLGCEDQFYQIELKIPLQLEIRDLDGQNGPDIHYYNNTASPDYVDTDELEILGPFFDGLEYNVYYINLSDDNLLPSYNGIQHRDIRVSLGTSGSCPCGEFGEVQVSTQWRSVCDPECAPAPTCVAHPDCALDPDCNPDPFCDPIPVLEGRYRLLGPPISTDLYYRCSGPCCGPAVSTCDFSFDRITPGWHLPDPLATQPPNLNTLPTFTANDLGTIPELKQNRVYERDSIGVLGIGSIGPGEVCDSIAECNGTYSTYIGANLESFYFDISYNNTNPSVQYFLVDQVESVFEFYQNGEGCDDSGIIIHEAEVELVEYFDGTTPINADENCSECIIRFHPSTSAYVALWPDYPNWPVTAERYKAVLKSKMIVKETTLAEASNHGFDQYPIIQGQFKYLSSGSNEHQSCDPYHDNMIVFNTDLNISEFSVLAESNYALGWGYSKPGSLCSRRFGADYSVAGGLFGFDEFPNEFRPLLQIGNDDQNYNHIDIDLPENYGLVQGCYSPAMKVLYRDGDANLWTFGSWKFLNHGPDINTFGDNISFDNFYESGDGGTTVNWPILEHDGYPITILFRGNLASLCPLRYDEPNEEINFSFPYRDRFDPNNNEVGVHNPYITPSEIITSEIAGTDHSLTLGHGGGLSEIAIFDQIGTIDDLEIVFTSSGGAYYLDEAWIVDLPDDGVSITGIDITSPYNVAAIDAGDGHWYLQAGPSNQPQCWRPNQTIARNVAYKLDVHYAIDQGYCNTLGDDIDLELGYGLTCFNLPPNDTPVIPEAFCYYDNYTLGLDLQESSAIWFGSNTFNETWCSESDISFVYDVDVLTNSASITNGQFTGNYPPELVNGNVDVNYNNVVTSYSLSNGTFDINLAALFTNGQLTEDDLLQLTFTFSGESCFNVPEIGEFNFAFQGTDICGNYDAVNSTPDQVFVDFTEIEEENYFCPDCACENLSITYNDIDSLLCNTVKTFTANANFGAGICDNQSYNWLVNGQSTGGNSSTMDYYFTEGGFYIIELEVSCPDEGFNCYSTLMIEVVCCDAIWDNPSPYPGGQNAVVLELRDLGGSLVDQYNLINTEANFELIDLGGGEYEGHLTGEVISLTESDQSWALDVRYINPMSWTEWSSQMTIEPPVVNRDYKNDNGQVVNEHEDWIYWELDDANSQLVGLGTFTGTNLPLEHAPSNLLFAFQMGDIANNVNIKNGFGGWFTWDGTISKDGNTYVNGTGDIAFDIHCCECDELGDTSPPIWTGEDDEAVITVECGNIDGIMVTVTDNCSSDVTLTFYDQFFSGGCLGSVHRFWTATDECGNSITFSQMIHFDDTMDPILSGVPANASYSNINDVPPPPNVTATDNCDPSVSVSFTETVNDNCPDEFTIVRTWTAGDACLNMVTASQTIYINCVSEPKPFCFIQPDVISSGFSGEANIGNDVLARAERYQIAADLAFEGSLTRLFSGSYKYDEFSSNWKHLANFELDQNGNYDNYRLLPIKENVLGLGGYLNPEDGRYNTILSINNDDGELLTLKEYRDYTSGFYGSIQSYDFSSRLDLNRTYYPVVGHTWNEEIKSDVFVMLVNPNNNDYVSKKYGGEQEQQRGRAVLTYGRELITFGETTTKDGQYPLDLLVMKLDGDLNQLITKRVRSTKDCNDKASISEHVNDADWSGGMAYFTGYITDSKNHDKAYVSCVDPESLEVIKTFTLTFGDLETRGLKIRSVKDVGLYVVGEVFSEGYKQGFVALIKVYGPCETSLEWFKITHNNEFPDGQYSLNGIDVGNQELIITGTFNKKPSDPSIENQVIVIDSDLNGEKSCCLIPKLALYKEFEFCGKDIELQEKIVRLNITKAPNAIETPEPESICDDKKSNDMITDDYYSEIDVYPNPSNGLFNVILKSETDFINSITFYSLDGAQLLSKRFNLPDQVNKTSVDLSDISGGMYILELETSSKKLHRKKITVIK